MVMILRTWAQRRRNQILFTEDVADPVPAAVAKDLFCEDVAVEAEDLFGEDVAVAVRAEGRGLEIEVVRGLDKGLLHVIGAEVGGTSAVAVPGVAALLELDAEGASIVPLPGESAELVPDGASKGRKVQGRIHLLRGDTVVLGGVRVEVAT